jgi:phosphatidylserine/phosphatidylglycerophosphate/cardiolipin synthase-like enzyme
MSSGELLHAKAIVVDRRSVLFGSANWSAGGFIRNHEIDLEIHDNPVVAASFLAQMESDWRAAA